MIDFPPINSNDGDADQCYRFLRGSPVGLVGGRGALYVCGLSCCDGEDDFRELETKGLCGPFENILSWGETFVYYKNTEQWI